MRKVAPLIFSALLASAALPAWADMDVVIAPEVDTWVMEQPEADVVIEGDIAVGGDLPGDVTIVEVPDHDKYGYVYVNKKRLLVDRGTRKVIKVY